MSKKKQVLSLLAVLFISEVLLGAFGYLTAYLQMHDTVGVLATVSYVIQQLLTNLPIFVSVGVAFCLAQKKGLSSALWVLSALLPFTLLYQTALTFLDYYYLQEELFGTSLLLGLLSGLFAGILASAVLFALLFFLPWLLFLRGKQSDGDGGVYAALSAMLVLLLYGLLEETAALLSHLSENFWIIKSSEILSFALFCLLRVAVAAFGFLVIRLTEKRVPRIAEKYIHHGNGDCI